MLDLEGNVLRNNNHHCPTLAPRWAARRWKYEPQVSARPSTSRLLRVTTSYLESIAELTPREVLYRSCSSHAVVGKSECPILRRLCGNIANWYSKFKTYIFALVTGELHRNHAAGNAQLIFETQLSLKCFSSCVVGTLSAHDRTSRSISFARKAHQVVPITCREP